MGIRFLLALPIAPALLGSLVSAQLVPPAVQDEREVLLGQPDRSEHERGELRPFLVQGRVLLPSGAPAAGAVVVTDVGGKAVTDTKGHYRLDLALAADASVVQLTAVHSGLGASLLASTRLPVAPIAGHARANDLELGAGGSCTPSWLPILGDDPDDAVAALAVYDDGSGGGPALFVGGVFTSAGGVGASRIAKWDGATWSPLGSGTTGIVTALAVHDDGSGSGAALFVGGWFTTAGGVSANYIAKWDGTAWSTLGSGMNDRVLSLAVYDDGSGGGPALYAGGWFTLAGGTSAPHIARWDGTTWSNVGDGMGGAVEQKRVHALVVHDDGTGGGLALYAGGNFKTATGGGGTANHIAKWDGTSWSALGIGMNNFVLALTVHDDGSGGGPALYAGGLFTTADGLGVNHIASWDGANWSTLGSGMNDRVYALATYDDASGGGPALYAGGLFTNAGGANANRIAKWNGSSWSGLASGMNDGVLALAVYDDGQVLGPALYVGGGFTTSAPGDSFLARWQGCAGAPGVAYCFGDGSASACPCGNAGAFGAGCANSSGSGAMATAEGSTSVSADDLEFAGSQLLPNQPALLFAGSNSVNGGAGIPFGDGLRCAGGQVRRLGVRTPNALGNASWGPGLGAIGAWSAGDTRRFQLWYRDPTGSPCGNGFNLSNGYELTFTN